MKLLTATVVLLALVGCCPECQVAKRSVVRLIALEADKTRLAVGEEVQLRVLVHRLDTVIDQTGDCVFTSSNKGVVRVLPGGVVMGVSAGKAKIVAILRNGRSRPLRMQVVP